MKQISAHSETHPPPSPKHETGAFFLFWFFTRKTIMNTLWFSNSSPEIRYFHEISYLLHQFLQTYISPTKQNQNSIHHEISQFVSRFKADYTAYLGGTSVNYGVLEMYDYIADKLGECLGSRYGMTSGWHLIENEVLGILWNELCVNNSKLCW